MSYKYKLQIKSVQRANHYVFFFSIIRVIILCSFRRLILFCDFFILFCFLFQSSLKENLWTLFHMTLLLLIDKVGFLIFFFNS